MRGNASVYAPVKSVAATGKKRGGISLFPSL
jgi:hypothetical protein